MDKTQRFVVLLLVLAIVFSLFTLFVSFTSSGSEASPSSQTVNVHATGSGAGLVTFYKSESFDSGETE